MMEKREMVCLEFRRHCGGDPGIRDAAFLEHRLACRACGAFAEDVRWFDGQLKMALAVEVPEGLVERVVADISIKEAHRMRWVAMAASLTIIFAAVVGIIRLDGSDVSATEIVEHMVHEPELLIPVDTTVEPARLYAVVNRGGAELNDDLGDVSYAGLCNFRGKLVAHLVVRGENGPVTILLLPDETVDEATAINEGGFHGTIVPAGDGSIAIIGAEQEPMDALRRQVVQAVQWQI
jgi:Protein of unknown function (DUF3379)